MKKQANEIEKINHSENSMNYSTVGGNGLNQSIVNFSLKDSLNYGSPAWNTFNSAAGTVHNHSHRIHTGHIRCGKRLN